MTTNTLWPSREARQTCVEMIAQKLYWRHTSLHEARQATSKSTRSAYIEEADGILKVVERELGR